VEVSIYKILKPIDGEHWNLKPGCQYEIADQVAARLIESGSIEPVIENASIETAMQPKPGASKRVRKSNKRSDDAGDSSRGEETPASDD
jgi:hypothetical protein